MVSPRLPGHNHNHHHTPSTTAKNAAAAAVSNFVKVLPQQQQQQQQQRRRKRRRDGKNANNPYRASSSESAILMIPVCLACLAIGWELFRLVRSLVTPIERPPWALSNANNNHNRVRQKEELSLWHYDQWCTSTALSTKKGRNDKSNRNSENEQQDEIYCQYFLPLDLQDFLPSDPAEAKLPLSALFAIGGLLLEGLDDDAVQGNESEKEKETTSKMASKNNNTTNQDNADTDTETDSEPMTDDLDHHFDRLGHMLMNPSKSRLALYPPTPKILIEARRNITSQILFLAKQQQQQQQQAPLLPRTTDCTIPYNSKNQTVGTPTKDGASSPTIRSARVQRQKRASQTTKKLDRYTTTADNNNPHYHERQDDFALLSRRGLGGSHYFNQDRAVLIDPYPVFQQTNSLKKKKKYRRKKKNTIVGDDDDNKNNVNFFMGIFDGHGVSGHIKSEYTATMLPKLVLDRLSKLETTRHIGTTQKYTDDQIRRALASSFWQVHARQGPASGGNHKMADSGCTASIVLRLQQSLYFANTGDSRSFLIQIIHPSNHQKDATASQQNHQKNVTIPLQTKPHKPNDPVERQRIVATGCVVIDPIPFQDPTARVTPSLDGPGLALAMSRSIGDYDLEKCGVIPEPTIQRVDLDAYLVPPPQQQPNEDTTAANQNIILLAVSVTDGMFDFVSLDEIAHGLAAPYLRTTKSMNSSSSSILEEEGASPLELAAEDLIRTASDRWVANSSTSPLYPPYRDDITIAVKRVL